MAAKFAPPPPQVQDLPICFFPGCTERAPYGYGCTLRSAGWHFCGKHRPDEAAKSGAKPIAVEVRDGR